jgi:predicted nuclease of predicted toxin-antitoxin system
VRFLLDENQSPRLVILRVAAGHDAVHVSDLGLKGAADHEILAVALAEHRTVAAAAKDNDARRRSRR